MKTLLLVFFCIFPLSTSAQWQSDTRLSNDISISHTSLNNAWCIAASNNFVHVVYTNSGDGVPGLYYKRSADWGLNWGTEIQLANSLSMSFLPCISVSGLNVHVAWDDFRNGHYEIYYKRSTDAGVSWGADTRLTNNGASRYGPSVSVSGQTVHIVWDDERDGNREIYYKRSTNGGLNWQPDQRLTDNSFSSSNPSISVSGTLLIIVWQDSRNGQYQLYHKRSSDGGLIWGQDTRITNTTEFSGNPSLSVTGSNVNLVWNDTRDGNFEIYYKRSTDGGINWGADNRLTNNSFDSEFPSIAATGQGIHIVWYDTRFGNPEILGKRSTTGGVSWESDMRLTSNTAVSSEPSVAVSGSVVNVVWSDNRDGNYEIYYKRDPTGNPIGIKIISSEIPKQYSLSQNYPNPFNPATNIRFSIPVSGNVKLTVFDMLGREVETLVNENLSAGTFNADWDASKYSSGVYFYKFETAEFSEIKKMVLVK